MDLIKRGIFPFGRCLPSLLRSLPLESRFMSGWSTGKIEVYKYLIVLSTRYIHFIPFRSYILQLPFMSERVGKRDHAMQVATKLEDRNMVMGFIELGMSAVSNEAALMKKNVPMIGNLVVTEENRGKGVASALLATVEQKAKEWGYEDIAVTVVDTNTKALNLYNKCEYQKVADIDVNFCDEPGRYVLIKSLSSLPL